jgi:hypothetical protein
MLEETDEVEGVVHKELQEMKSSMMESVWPTIQGLDFNVGQREAIYDALKKVSNHLSEIQLMVYGKEGPNKYVPRR